MPTYESLPAESEYFNGKLFRKMVDDLRLAGKANLPRATHAKSRSSKRPQIARIRSSIGSDTDQSSSGSKKESRSIVQTEPNPKSRPKHSRLDTRPTSHSPSPGFLNREFEHRLRSVTRQLNPALTAHFAMSNSYLFCGVSIQR